MRHSRSQENRSGGLLAVVATLLALLGAGCLEQLPDGPGPDGTWNQGQTEFVNAEPGTGESGGGRSMPHADAGMAAGGDGGSSSPAQPAPGAPGGRVAEVEEAEIFRVHENRLYALNTYKGLVVYDLNDPKKPTRLARLPIYGYPIEMFFKGEVAYVLVKDALFVTQDAGKLRFQRHHVSRLVTVDLSDVTRPRVLQEHDIVGLLREGVSRKVEDTIYVVSHQPAGYWYEGWGMNSPARQQETAHVYSYNVADPKRVLQVGKLQLFDGGSGSSGPGGSDSRWFTGVSISATANTLMVVENWQAWQSAGSGGFGGCGRSESYAESKVSLVDISDPSGAIRVHTQFTQRGALSDQFKQTYLYNPQTKEGTYFGIFARDEWTSCDRVVKNYMVAVDITDGKNPVELSSVAFGKPNETVRGTAFDVHRRVAYAITAQNRDPLYAISIEDPRKLKVLSEIDGLSGDMSVFRLIQQGKFLLAVGRDTSDACTGFDQGWSSSRMAVSLIDVQDLARIRLVQRRCVAVNSGKWQSSSITWNQDQAHKLLGMYSEGDLNLVGVPVTFWEQDTGPWAWRFYAQRSAVGLMRYDLSAYDATKEPAAQRVLSDLPTLYHPEGEVRRTIFFKHRQGGVERRMVATLSETHLALTDLSDVRSPVFQSVTELAPYVSGLYRVGNALVEAVTPFSPEMNYWGHATRMDLRIRRADDPAPLEQRKLLASFSVGGVQSVLVQGTKLVFLRSRNAAPDGTPAATEVLIYDLSNPEAPRVVGRGQLPTTWLPSYHHYCDGPGFYYRYSFDAADQWVTAGAGIVALTTRWDYSPVGNKSTRRTSLQLVDLSNPASPRFVEQPLSTDDWEYYGLVPSPDDPTVVYLSARRAAGSMTVEGQAFDLFRYYAVPYRASAGQLTAGDALNLPGQLMKITTHGGQRLLLTHDRHFERRANVTSTPYLGPWDYFREVRRLNLLRQVTLSGQVKAELRDSRLMDHWYLSDVVLDGAQLFMLGQRSYDYYSGRPSPDAEQGDHLLAFDLSALKLDLKSTSALGTWGASLVGFRQSRLFVLLPGTGLLVTDTSQLAAPRGISFTPTLGWATHLLLAKDRAYLAAGHYGVVELPLGAVSLPAS
ncbi:MAG: beta-propeller domain-containing protein [Deltaproteobacteria bacterium]|nr:beta-propeller domain-containing protein [Deltaproteobacteria bacterium]